MWVVSVLPKEKKNLWPNHENNFSKKIRNIDFFKTNSDFQWHGTSLLHVRLYYMGRICKNLKKEEQRKKEQQASSIDNISKQ